MAEDMRELALQLLMRVNEEGAFLKEELSMQLMRYQYLEKKERAFLARLTEGCVERQITLDYVIGQFSKVKLSKMKPESVGRASRISGVSPADCEVLLVYLEQLRRRHDNG